MPSLSGTLKSLSDLIHYSRRRSPTAPDGLYAAEAAPAVANKPQDHGKLYDFIDDIQSAVKRGPPIEFDEQTLDAAVDAIKHANTTGINDRDLLLEKIFTLLERLPPGSTIQNKLRDAVISLLYSDLPHPPATFLGKKYAFRTADGSYNNITIPELGKARTPYARTVQSKTPIPYSSLPDPDLVFDALLKRDGTAPHPSGISSLLFAFANLIIHSLFKTDEKFTHINNSSSYLDLSPLYGDSEATQKSVRVLDGRGLLYNDTFADQRMLMMPPSTPALLIIFARNHNYIATKILQINERRKYVNPPPANDPAALMTQDDDIFNRARLVNCAHFMNIVLSDYIGAILGLTKDGSDWTLDPLETIREIDRTLIGRGLGNVVSVEFNLLYRWHATVSEPDEKWTEDLFRRMFPDIPWQSLTPAEFRERVKELRIGPSSTNASMPVANPTRTASEVSNAATGTPHKNPTTGPNAPAEVVADATNGQATLGTGVKRTKSSASTKSASGGSVNTSTASSNGPNTWQFGGLVRDPETGSFDDDALADILQNATATVAQAFRARGTPEVLRVIEVMGIEQARSWGVCTMNEFRQFMGLKAYGSFEEWNPNPEIARAAEALYGHIDNLELYVGMQAEETKIPGPGTGLCPGYTISRAILADAIALVRGDRFLTTDFTPYNLTAWGFQDCARDTSNGAFGSGMSKILLRGLPSNYTYKNVYGLFPFYTPQTMSTTLTKLELAKQYDFSRPKLEQKVVSVNTWDGVSQVLGDYRTFKTPYGDNMRSLTNGYGFFLAFDEPSKHKADMELVRNALFPDDEAMVRYGQFYRKTTTQLIQDKSFSLVGKHTRSVDIVRDVLNLVPVHWVSTQIAGIPLKTPATPRGVHTEQEVYQFLAVVFTYIFLDVQPETGWVLKVNAEEVAAVLQNYIKTHINGLKGTRVIGRLKDSLLDWLTGETDESDTFLKRLAASGRSTDELTYNVFGIIIAASPNFSQAAVLVVNFYLDEKREVERKDIINLVNQDTPAGNRRLLGYILEAMRLDPQAPGIFREAALDVDVQEGQGEPVLKVHKGQTVFVSLRNANFDPTVFGPDPNVIDPTRSFDKYKTFGSGMHACLGQWFVQGMMPQVMRSIFTLKNIRRAPGQSGMLNRFEQDLYGTTRGYLYVDAKGNVSPWAASMLVQYDI